jgi:iron(III) transport system ATP-binding protein
MSPVLELVSITQAYGGQTVVDGLSLSLAKGAIGCLLGPSGCGKTTVLRCIAGFEPLTSGEIRIGGKIMSAAGMRVPTERRNVGIVFQDYALFPHLNVEANVAFGLHRWPSSARKQRISQMLETVSLQSLGRRYPHELSGGQQQRVALVRALAPQPDLLLLDEPFSNLDVDLRERLGLEVRDILKQQGTTALMVTHDQHEAFVMADAIGVMSAGRIQQWDNASTLYHHPANRFVADFIGQGALLPATVNADSSLEIELGACMDPAADPLAPAPAGSGCDVLLRPEDIVHDDTSPVKAEVLHKAFRGADILYTLQLASGARIVSRASSEHDRSVGERIGIRLRNGRVTAFRK